ncbi:MAG: [FeFe] hydrogenase H-cluster maturation GTPase HydF [Bacteroidales bacterium]|nr:[FeFe] hydrogenase H-cluster maturation GTPase HydF [Bacteroidales bacterium]
MHNEIFIGLLGRRNQGKSALMNLLTGQQVSIVSDTPGTTTDPVKKSMELFGIGRCVWIDTAGWDDGGGVGFQRVQRSRRAVDLLQAAVVLFSHNDFGTTEREICALLAHKRIPFVLLHNKRDEMPLSDALKADLARRYPTSPLIDFSVAEAETQAATATARPDAPTPAAPLIAALQTLLGATNAAPRPVLEGIVHAGDLVLLVTPIDAEAPKDRLILPQVQISRQCLDLHAGCLLCQTEELAHMLRGFRQPPRLVITDSQAFKEVHAILPAEQSLTSFSICLARQKGPFDLYLQGTPHIADLQDGDKVLLLESCTHQTNCHDIGRVKLPNLLRRRTGKQLQFEFVSGLNPLPGHPADYALVIQCGGCMVTGRQLEQRLLPFAEAGVPVSNYGMALAYLQGIFERATAPFRQTARISTTD